MSCTPGRQRPAWSRRSGPVGPSTRGRGPRWQQPLGAAVAPQGLFDLLSHRQIFLSSHLTSSPDVFLHSLSRGEGSSAGSAGAGGTGQAGGTGRAWPLTCPPGSGRSLRPVLRVLALPSEGSTGGFWSQLLWLLGGSGARCVLLRGGAER